MTSSRNVLEFVARRLCRLADWNDAFPRGRHVVATALLAGIAAAIVLTGYTHWKIGLNAPPTTGGDAVDYDSLAWELSQGRGFQTNYDSASFRAPYESAGAGDELPRGGLHPCFYRPPLYPLLLAAIDRLAGRQFAWRRLLNILATSITCAIVVALAWRMGGPVPAAAAFFNLLVVDWRIRFYSRELLTESLATLLVLMLTLAFLKQRRRNSIPLAVLIGVLTGLLMLVRSMCLLWWPVLIGMARAGAAGQGEASVEGADLRAPRARLRLALVAAAAVTVSPWVFRNVSHLGWRFLFGTQAALESPAGYGDGALSRLGQWTNLHPVEAFESSHSPESIVQRDRRQALAAWERARSWALENWFQLPLLAGVKIFSELRPWGIGELYVLAFALVGLIGCRGASLASVTLGLLAACLFGIALTWSAGGRFLVPLLPNLHVFAAVGVWSAVAGASRTQAVSRHLQR